MSKVTNTAKKAKNNPFYGLGVNIEAQEAAGQRELVNSSQLPVKWNVSGGRMQDAHDMYEKLGINCGR